jgi:MarR family transcriptional regulator, transcriptional regulator for hemolysin
MRLAKYDYENSLGRKIVMASKTVQQAFDLELQNMVDVTLAQWRAINIIRLQNGITQREIANRLSLDASSLIPLIDRLEKKGLVKRIADVHDRRINRLYLTDKAVSLLDPMYACAISVKKILTKDISDDHIKVLQDCLEQITQNLVNHYRLEVNCGIEANVENSTLKTSSRLVRHKSIRRHST